MPKGHSTIPEEQRKKIGASVKEYRKIHPVIHTTETRLKLSMAMKGKERSFIHNINRYEAIYGGMWYGSIRYNGENKKQYPPHPKNYCELWTEDLKERIRSYWGYASTLSGEPETSLTSTGLLKSISCHHVYYQTKACCIWDEDEKGYYANINIRTTRNPESIRYYIDGDPNKFVVLTASEHKQTDFNKLKWIRTFEDIVVNQGGKSYFTKMDIHKLLSEDKLINTNDNNVSS